MSSNKTLTNAIRWVTTQSKERVCSVRMRPVDGRVATRRPHQAVLGISFGSRVRLKATLDQYSSPVRSHLTAWEASGRR
jgi:hypothetical protein